MRFPLSHQLMLPCRLAGVVPGAQHVDGRRYLPLLVFELERREGQVVELGVVDRHHRVDQALVGQQGVAKLVFLLSSLRLQPTPYHSGLFAEAGVNSKPSTRPLAFGQVIAVPTWEAEREHLPYEALYTELLLDVGIGTIGVRTNVTAENLAATIGKPRLERGDWLAVERSRIDILAFSIQTNPEP